MNQGDISIQRLTLAIACGISILITILVPAAYFFISYQHLRSELHVLSVLSADDVTGLIRSDSTLWRYEDLRLSEMLEQRSRNAANDSRIIYDTSGAVIAGDPSAVPLFHISHTQDIYDAGVVVARIEISRSLAPLLFSTLLVALCSAACVAVVFFTLRTLLNRSTRKAYQALRDNRKKYRSLHETLKERMAYSDQLTELPNRTLFLDRLKQAVASATQNDSTLAVFFLDLDRFKVFNDTMGHAVGDQLLIGVSRRVQRQIRSSDTLARMGGDEFCIVAINPGEKLNAPNIAQKLIDSMLPPFRIGCHELHVTTSIGIAVFPDDGIDAETLVRNADLAMYSAKEAGRNTYNFYSPEMNRNAHIRMELETGMRNALELGEFFLEFQPIMNAETRTIAAAEALVRWNHPTRGRIPPNEFIPLAEETGLILPLGEWVLRTVCSTMKTWNDSGLPQIRFSVNVSSRQIEQQNFADIVRNVLHATGANAAQLEIELTESCLVNHASTNLAEVFDLRKLGISIAIDDFGTGYSSLGYIKTLPIDHIKIDRSFVTDISSNIQDQAIVEAIITMSQKLGIRNIAEGVETFEQLEFLQTQGCNEIQGYYFHRPLSLGDFEILLRAQGNFQMEQRFELAAAYQS